MTDVKRFEVREGVRVTVTDIDQHGNPVPTPAEQCFSVKEGYEVDAVYQGWSLVPLAEALTIRSAEEVRREALEEVDQKLMSAGLQEEGPGRQLVRALIDTPAPSTDTTTDAVTPKIPKAIAVKCPICSGSGKKNSATICMHCHGDGKVVALAAQTGGE